MKKTFITLLFLFLVFSCKSGVQVTLDKAEALLDQKPDSALIILQGTQQNNLRTIQEDARYALLMSKALDKNYIDVRSDSLIIRAVDYYSGRCDVYYKMLAYYYHGIVLKNSGEYSSAIIALENAEKEAIKLQDFHYLGLIYRNMSSVFSLTYNYTEAIASQKKAVSFFDLADEPLYKEYAEFSLATGYLNNKEFSRADSLLDVIIRRNKKNSSLLFPCILRQASVLAETDSDIAKAISNYRQVPEKYYQVLDYAYYALSLEKAGERDSSDFWIGKGSSLCRNQTDSVAISFIKSKIELRRGHYPEAFDLVNHVTQVQDSLTRTILKQSISVAQRDYYKSVSALQKERISSMKKIWGLISLIVLLSFALIVLGIILRSKEKDRLLKDLMTSLAIKKQHLDDAYKMNASLLGSLFSSRIDHLDMLSERYYRMDEGEEKDAVFKEIKESIYALRRNPELLLSLEKDLNRYCDGIMTKFRAQVPRVKGDNLKIITLFFAGVSDEIIHLLLNTVSSNSLRMTRSRFRKEILAANAPDSELFFNMLEKRKSRS